MVQFYLFLKNNAVSWKHVVTQNRLVLSIMQNFFGACSVLLHFILYIPLYHISVKEPKHALIPNLHVKFSVF